MIRKFLPILVIVFAVCFSAGVAQSDIFVRQGGDKETSNSSSKGGSVFLRPFKKDDKKSQKPRSTVNYGSRTVVNRMETKILSDDLKLLAAWKRADRKPRTAGEMLSYARAYRAEDTMRVLQERQRTASAVSAAKEERLRKYKEQVLAQAPDPQAVIEFNAKVAAKDTSSAYRSYGSSRSSRTSSEPRVRRVYTPSKSSSGPTRVFRDYR